LSHSQCDGRQYDGLAYDFAAEPDPKWIGLDEALLTGDITEPDLGVSLQDARLLEEIAHMVRMD